MKIKHSTQNIEHTLLKVWKILFCLFVITLIACAEQRPGINFEDDIENSLAFTQNQTEFESRLIGTDDFSGTLYPLLTAQCADCHQSVGIATPLIAHPDVSIAQTEILDNQKVNLSNPTNSRIVTKLKNEFHYCWSVCDDDAQALQLATEQWAALINAGGIVTPIDRISSQSLTLADGVLGGGIPRFDTDAIALFEFKEGSGNITRDTSGVMPALDLSLEGTVWAAGQGIEIQTGIALATATDSKKLYNIIAGGANATQQYSIETWVIPANVTQEGPARLVTYSDGTQVRNFTMGQQTYNYVFRNRNTSPDINQNGTPALHTLNAEQVLQMNQQHVVMTFDAISGRKIYVNGELKGSENLPAGATLNNWSANHIFAIGNEITNNRLFKGIVQLVAIHKTALTSAQVLQNFDAGVGEKFMLTFDVSQVTGQVNSFIRFQVSELDKFSYLFNKPVFLSPSANGLRVKNIQISVNGQIPVAGQTWRNLDALVTQNEQALSPLAAVISKDKGPELDEFSVVFEILGDKKNLTVKPPLIFSPVADVVDTAPRAGIRTFEQINHTMASITGIDPNTANINTTYLDIKQQLPSLPNINGFLASHQVGIAKLSLEYCDTLIESINERDVFFGVNSNFDFNAPATQAFTNSLIVDQMLQTLMDKIMGIDLINQPDASLTKQELVSLIGDLTANCNSATQCDAARTKTVVKASCSAILGSAAITIQ